MNYLSIIKKIWKESKLGFLLSIVSMSILIINNILLLGRRFFFIRKWLENKVRVPWNPDSFEANKLKFYADFSLRIYRYTSVEKLKVAYPDYRCYVEEFRETRYCVIVKNNNVYVSVGGSVNEQNWADNLSMAFRRNKHLDKNLHYGYGTISEGIADDLRNKRIVNKESNIHITGSSLGGVVGIGVGLHLNNSGYNIKKVYVFANPRLSDTGYGNLPVTCIHNKRDPVVYLPVFTLFHRYKHSGRRLILDNDGWYEYKDNYITNILMSVWFIDSVTHPLEHLKYAGYLRRFIESLK